MSTLTYHEPIHQAGNFDYSDAVVVKVGPGHEEFHFPRELLKKHSEFFRGALSGQFQSAIDGVVTLDDISPDTFMAFAIWMHICSHIKPKEGRKKAWLEWARCLDKFQHDWKHDRPRNGMTIEEMKAASMARMGMYVLADRLMCEPLKRKIFEAVFTTQKDRSPWFETIIYAYDNLLEEDEMLCYLADSYCINASGVYENIQKEFLNDLPHAFLVKVMIGLTDAVSRGSNWEPYMSLDDYLHPERASQHLFNLFSIVAANEGCGPEDST